ncbi:MAG: hypothetical protein MJY85_06780 [Fibrobacter sp.]|nr:hypothetical protein [Fibrobacter sp.]
MKKISMALAIAGLGAAALMSACDNGATNAKKPTKAQECSTGLTTECLIGTWDVNGFVNRTTGEMNANVNYTSNPGKLTFNDAGTFKFEVPAAVTNPAVAGCNPVYGSWSVTAGTLNLKGTSRNECLAKNTYTGTPKVEVGASTVTLTLDVLYFMFNVTDEAGDRDGFGETFSISAN